MHVEIREQVLQQLKLTFRDHPFQFPDGFLKCRGFGPYFRATFSLNRKRLLKTKIKKGCQIREKKGMEAIISQEYQLIVEMKTRARERVGVSHTA